MKILLRLFAWMLAGTVKVPAMVVDEKRVSLKTGYDNWSA